MKTTGTDSDDSDSVDSVRPVDAIEIELPERGEQRFERDEPDPRRGPTKVVDPAKVLRRLDTDAHPDVRRPVEPASKVPQPLRRVWGPS
jgi:hypothetical protein